MTKEDKLKWWINFKVILIFNYNFIQINQNGKTKMKHVDIEWKIKKVYESKVKK